MLASLQRRWRHRRRRPPSRRLLRPWQAPVALLVLVIVLYRDLRWIPMLVTFLLALKTYWVALAIR